MSLGDMLCDKLSDDEEPADYVGMLLGYWLRRDKKLPEQYRIAKKLREAIAVQVCVCADVQRTGGDQRSCVVQMSFGVNASDQMQKKLQEAMATEELQDALAGINIDDDDNRSNVSMEQMIADEIISITSSAAAMERETLEKRVVELERQLLRASAQRTAVRTATAAELRNQAIHDRSLAGTAGIVCVYFCST
jgi:hypothetical protein